MQHVEFFHQEHFLKNYHRSKPVAALAHFIEFFWETDFDVLWKTYPRGFSDALFPNIGYTYLINLGTPFVMQLENRNYTMKSDGFLPRHSCIECYHQPGNKIFGIKFRISPVLFEKRINFSEYKEYIFPLSYLLDPLVLDQIKQAGSFGERVKIVNNYYQPLVKRFAGSLQPVKVVSEIIQFCETRNKFDFSIEELAERYSISSRTLQRYFESTMSITTKKALQILRIRKVVSDLLSSPDTFHYSRYGYYDYSHFIKHLKSFLQKDTLKKMKPHLLLLEGLHK
ncbi:MAG: hypothetical protein GC171_11125 [Terrimonas sp.]|nr:hypothetical protein [Terrimonas sp.]